MAFGCNTSHEIGPSLGVPAENEKRRSHAARRESIEDDGRRVGVWPVIEREGHGAAVCCQTRDRPTEQPTISVKGTVGKTSGGDDGAGGGLTDHTATRALLSTV